MLKIPKTNKSDRYAFVIIIAYVIFFTTLAIGRHLALKSYLNDLGTYDQAIWNTLHGNFFGLTCSMLDVDNYLSAHFSPILLIFVPLYAIFASPNWFLFGQAMAVGLSALPVYLFARNQLNRSLAALVFLLAYLTYPFLSNALLYDFHEVVMGVLFAAWMLYFLETGHDRLFLLFAVLLALTQEHLSLLVLMSGIYLAFIKKRTRFGLYVAVGALAYFLLVVGFVMPYFSDSGKPALLAENSNYPSRYAWLGRDFPEIVGNVTQHPVRVAAVMFSPERVKYLYALFIPTFALGLFAWPSLIVLPLVLVNLLSSNGMMFSVNFYHSAILAPFFFFGAILAFKRWFAGFVVRENIWLCCLLVAAAGSFYFWSQTPWGRNYVWSDYFPSEHALQLAEVKKIVPRDASVSVQHNLGPHFSGRAQIFRFPLGVDKAEYVILDKTDPYAGNPRQVFQFDYALQISRQELEMRIQNLKNSTNHELIYARDGYAVFRRKN